MTERKKKILSLLVSTSLLFGLTGCNKSVDKTNVNDSDTNYSEEIGLNNLSNYFIVEIKNLNNEKELYLSIRNTIFSRFNSNRCEFKIAGKEIILVKCFTGNNYTSEYGEVINIVPIKQFISIYSELKENYTEEEINKVFESIKTDYDKLIKNDKIKKLELK